jgi:hypothetical protein
VAYDRLGFLEVADLNAALGRALGVILSSGDLKNIAPSGRTRVVANPLRYRRPVATSASLVGSDVRRRLFARFGSRGRGVRV